jgi:hypothetical protein
VLGFHLSLAAPEADSTFIVVIQVHPDFASPRNIFGSWCREGDFLGTDFHSECYQQDAVFCVT